MDCCSNVFFCFSLFQRCSWFFFRAWSADLFRICTDAPTGSYRKSPGISPGMSRGFSSGTTIFPEFHIIFLFTSKVSKPLGLGPNAFYWDIFKFNKICFIALHMDFKKHFVLFVECVQLSLSSNKITVIEPGGFAGLVKLKQIWLYDNKISHIKANMFVDMVSCLKISLEDNQIFSIEPGSFNGLDNLETLDLSYNKISSLDTNMFSELKNCTMLYLRKNNISVIEHGALHGLGKVHELQLELSAISKLDPFMFNALKGT